MKEFKRKVSFVFVLILAILSTICTCLATGEIIEELRRGEVIIDSQHIHTFPDGTYIPANQLWDYYDLYCCQKGTALTGYGSTYLVGSNGDELGVSHPYLTMNDIGMKILSQREPFASSTYKNKTIGHYRIAGTYIATPKEAYILSEMILADGLGENDYTQYAWWTTEAGSTGNTVEATDFSKEADAFEAYILQAADVLSTDQLKYKTAEFITAEGETKTYENAFDFEYNPEWVTTDEYEDLDVVWDSDTKQFTIGPFAIDYVGSTEQFGERPEVQFAGITGMNIYTDASSEPLVFEQDWNFVWIDGERTADTNSKFPLANEKFYIRVNYIENATMITNIKTEFRYMNACGVYQKLDGKYFEATWRQDYQNHYDTEYDEDGNPYQVYDYTEYWLELMSLTEHDSQLLALGMNGARWYEFVEIERNLGIKFGKVRIEKQIVDENGEEVDGSDDFFVFDLTVNGAQNSGSEKIKVKAGNAATSKVYWWFDGEAAPTYTVSEVPNEEYKEVSIEPSSGSLVEYKTVNVIAKNTKVNEGTLNIIKKVETVELNGEENRLEGQKFNFDVDISGTFKYDGNMYEDTTITVPVMDVVPDENREVAKIIWYGDEAPTYVVRELDHINAEEVSITPSSGSFADGQTITVTAINKAKIERGQIEIIKTLKNAELYPEEEIMKLKFNFLIKVDGYADSYVTLSPVRENNSYVWKYVSGYYRWFVGKNPNYSIEEKDNPAGTHFVTGSSNNNEVTVTDNKVSGVMKGSTNGSFVVNNNILNVIDKPHTGKLELIKKVEDEELFNKEFRFVVRVYENSFKYVAPDGTVAEAGTDENGRYYTINGGEKQYSKSLVLTNNSVFVLEDESNIAQFVVITPVDQGDGTAKASWVSGDFTWYGDTAPQYVVEENLVGEDVASSIEPSEGRLRENAADGSNGVKVTAWNRSTAKAGYLKIIKVLENAEGVPEDYINSLEFTFKISIDGYENPYFVTLTPKKVNNSYVWEYLSDKINWTEAEGAPNYTIEEIIPENAPYENVSGLVMSGTLQESNAVNHIIPTENRFTNKLKEYSGNLKILKEVTDDSIANTEFTFSAKIQGTFYYNGELVDNDTLVLNDIKVTANNPWTSGEIKWYGEEAPTYTVIEIDHPDANNISVLNGSGVIANGVTAVAKFVNEPEYTGGYLQITKKVDGGVEVDGLFTFKVTIGNNDPYFVKIKANETYRSDYYQWKKGEAAPTYSVEEVDLPAGCELVRIDNSQGSLIEDGIVNVVAFNKYEEHEGSFKITKQIIADEKLLDGLELPTFEISATISGTFEMDGEIVNDSSRVINITLKGGETYTSPVIKWWGNEAPTVTVTESNIPLGWKNIGISNNGAPIGDELEIVVTNQLDTLTIIDLTMKLAGNVWEDAPKDVDGKNTADSIANGLKDEFERAVKGVEVFIYKPDGSLAEVYDNGALISQPLYTDAIGHWEAPNMKVLDNGTYDVEFVYDGQTYEPTIFLATSNGDANAYRNASTSERDNWSRDSKALDYDREVVNNRINEIYGESAIAGNGLTQGKVSGNEGEHTIVYNATNTGDNLDTRAGLTNSTRLTSKVKTTDDNGRVFDVFKAKARTSVGGLTYPFDKKIHLDSVDTYISELGLVQYYKYSATYNYMLNINLGLVPRPDADLAVSKDLAEAKLIVNNNLTNYKVNKLEDYGQDVINRQYASDTGEIEPYKVSFTSTDYYYRAELYQSSAESSNIEAYDAIETYYKDLGFTPKDTEMEVYLKYNIKVQNQSSDYVINVNKINDYYDSSFELVNATVEKYIEKIDGVAVSANELGEKRVVAEPSTVNGSAISWIETEKGIEGSDGIVYNKMTADLPEVRLEPGQRAEIYVTFKVRKDTIGSVHEAIELGNKSNVAEIASYSTFDLDGKNAGKIDEDSAPGNVNIENYNEFMWYEDDTDQAPVLKVEMETTSKSIKGLAWEDNTNEGQIGTRNENEALIGGLTTQLVEKLTIKDRTGTFKDYDFVWPTNKKLSLLGGASLEEITGFDSTIETSRELTGINGTTIGEYKFINIPDGVYAVRFLYGNDKTQLEDKLNISGDPEAYTAAGVKYSGNEEILTANYDKEIVGRTVAVYNGQDYKSTVYMGQTDNLITNVYHDLNNNSNELSDARDSEARRLEVIAESETIMNSISEILATANDKAADHTELYNIFGMYAETAKIDLTTVKADGSQLGVNVSEEENKVFATTSFELAANNTNCEVVSIDFGLIERPETAIVLDKQIESIKIITNDNRVVFSADYEIIPKILRNPSAQSGAIAQVGEDYLVVEKELRDYSIAVDQLQALDKKEYKVYGEDEADLMTYVQNFRYINVDDAILQGTTIELNYNIAAYNVGDIDKTSEWLAEGVIKDAIANDTSIKTQITLKAEEARKAAHEYTDLNRSLEIGKYLGEHYYTNNNEGYAVTTRVRQIVDYVDNDAVFSQTDNNSKNHNWKSTNVNELTGNGYESQRLVSKDVIQQYEIIDINGINYVTNSRNNLALSVDVGEDAVVFHDGESAKYTELKEVSNAEFSKQLIPIENNEIGEQNSTSINLKATRTVSAQDDADQLQFDNIAEIVKIENSVGRRDMLTVTGNANPAGIMYTDPTTGNEENLGLFAAAHAERDSSATEVVTFAPPTGIKAEVPLTMQVLLISLVALAILAAGVVIIKKTVLK